MAVYEVVLRFQDREEIRLTDRPLEVGSHFQIAGNEWLVQRREAGAGRASVRYICVGVRDVPDELRERSSTLVGGSAAVRPGLAAAEPH